MWNYEKRLQYPVCITKSNPAIAKVIISQFGGPDGELSASMRYLSQRYAMPYREVAGLLTDIGTEELAHMEMICIIASLMCFKPLILLDFVLFSYIVLYQFRTNYTTFK